jgi:hypothetical protein
MIINRSMDFSQKKKKKLPGIAVGVFQVPYFPSFEVQNYDLLQVIRNKETLMHISLLYKRLNSTTNYTKAHATAWNSYGHG